MHILQALYLNYFQNIMVKQFLNNNKCLKKTRKDSSGMRLITQEEFPHVGNDLFEQLIADAPMHSMNQHLCSGQWAQMKAQGSFLKAQGSFRCQVERILAVKFAELEKEASKKTPKRKRQVIKEDDPASESSSVAERIMTGETQIQGKKKYKCRTKNRNQTFKRIFVKWLEQFFNKEQFDAIPIIHQINNAKYENYMSGPDFTLLFSQKLFEKHLEKYFDEKMIQRDLMKTGISVENKMFYMENINEFEAKFRQIIRVQRLNGFQGKL